MGMLLITSSPPAGLVHAGKGGNIILDLWSCVKVSSNIFPLPPLILDFHSTCPTQGISGALFFVSNRQGLGISQATGLTPGKG